MLLVSHFSWSAVIVVKRYAPAREINKATTKVRVTSGFPKNNIRDINIIEESTRFVNFGAEGANFLLIR